MNHDEIRALMAAYVDDELPGSERRLVEGHVAGCAECRTELAAVTALQRQVGKTLRARAETVEAPAESWAVLQARVAAEPVMAMPAVHPPRSGNHSHGAADAPAGRRVLRAFSLGFALIGALVFTWLVIVSPLIEQSQTASRKHKTPTPAPTSAENGPTPTAAVSARSFISLSPFMLPQDLAYMDDGIEKDGSRVTTFYNRKGDHFVTVTQTSYTPGEALPEEGIEGQVGDLPARLVTGVKGKITVGDRDRRTINYRDAFRLTWQTPFGTRLALVSNMPQDSVTPFAATLAVRFTHFGSSVNIMPEEGAEGSGMEAVDRGVAVSETHTYSYKHFIVLTQMADVGQEEPVGEPIELPNGVKATILRGLSGDAPASNHVFFEGRQLAMLGGGGGGGGEGPDYTPPPPPPPSIPFTDGVRLVWTQEAGGSSTRIDVLTNLPEDQALAYAAGMEPAPGQNTQLVTGAYIDRSILPKGGGLAGYVISAPSLPAEFYGMGLLTVTEGDGLIIENRYYDNTRFAVVTTRRDDGSPLPEGDAATINGQPGVIQDKQKGKALLSPQTENHWLVPLQDGEPRLIVAQGGGGGVKNATGPEQEYPQSIDYKNGIRITWTLDGARITLVTNLSMAEARKAAESITILGKDFTLISPVGGGWVGQLFTEGYDLWGPTELPADIVGMAPLEPIDANASEPEILFWNPADTSRFVILRQRAAKPGEIVGTPLSSTLLGQPYLLRQVQSSFNFSYGDSPKVISYDGIEITVIVDGTWIQIVTGLPQDEALKIAGSMVKSK